MGGWIQCASLSGTVFVESFFVLGTTLTLGKEKATTFEEIVAQEYLF
jgi:hypothetical protein